MSLFTRAMLLGALLFAGCGGGTDRGASFALYHLEEQLDGPVEDGDVTCPETAPVCPFTIELGAPAEYRLSGEPALGEDAIERAETDVAVNAVTGEPIVTVHLTDAGRRTFAELTARVARAGRRAGVWHHVAIVVDGEVVGFPAVDYNEYPDGIHDAPGIQFGADTTDAAHDVARRIRGDE